MNVFNFAEYNFWRIFGIDVLGEHLLILKVKKSINRSINNTYLVLLILGLQKKVLLIQKKVLIILTFLLNFIQHFFKV